MNAIVRTPATAVCAALVIATVATWMLGAEQSMVESRSLTSVLILIVAFVKIRFIGLYFMELREAPMVLRSLFEAYTLIVCGLLLVTYLAV